jgi:hypothetical protein
MLVNVKMSISEINYGRLEMSYDLLEVNYGRLEMSHSR